MTRVRLADLCPWGGGYCSTDVRVPWQAGEVRSVDDDLATYLVVTFPGLFEEGGAPTLPPPPPVPVPDPDPNLMYPQPPTPRKPKAPKPPKSPKGR